MPPPSAAEDAVRWGAAPKREPPEEDAAGDDAARAIRGDKAAGASAGTRPAPGNVFLTHAQSKRRQSGLYRSRCLGERSADTRQCGETGTVHVALCELYVPESANAYIPISMPISRLQFPQTE